MKPEVKRFTYCPLLVNISTVLQQVHHTVIVALPGSPDQWSGAILRANKYTPKSAAQANSTKHPNRSRAPSLNRVTSPCQNS